MRQAALRVPHGRRIIAVDIAEIALAIDERVADGEVLGEAHERVVDGLVAVRVEVTHHLADDLRALLEAARGIELQLPHGVENAPVDRLQAVAHVGQRPVQDRGQRVGQIALFQRLAQIDGFNGARAGQNRSIAHGLGINAPASGSQVPVAPQRPQSHSLQRSAVSCLQRPVEISLRAAGRPWIVHNLR